jgi:hypothetical protein
MLNEADFVVNNIDDCGGIERITMSLVAVNTSITLERIALCYRQIFMRLRDRE